MSTLPHPVPTDDLQSVLIRDSGHAGTIVTYVERDERYYFASLDDRKIESAERCVLVELAPPESLLESPYLATDYTAYLPDDAPVGVDLDGRGYALIGLGHVDALDDRLGVILWDSDDQ